jgi:hypothetical protein
VRVVALSLLLLAAACRAKSGAVETFGPLEPVTLDDLVWTLAYQSQETRSSPNHFIVGQADLKRLADYPILHMRVGRVIWDGGWLARLAGVEHPKDVPVLALAGQPVSSDADLKKGLQQAAYVGELALTVRGETDEVVLHLRTGEPITEALLRTGVAWRSDGTVAVTRAFRRTLLTDPAQVTRGLMLLPSDGSGRCVGRSLELSDAAPSFAPGNRVLRRLGFRHEDVLISLNGLKVCDGAFPASLLEAPRFDWALLRNGRPRTLTWTVVDALPAGASSLSPDE